MTGKPARHSRRLSEQHCAAWCRRAAQACSASGAVDDSAIEAAFAKAEVVISQRMMNQRLAPSAMEPRGVVAHYEPGKGTMTIWSSTQNPHILRTFIAALTGSAKIRCGRSRPRSAVVSAPRSTSMAKSTSPSAVSKRLGIPVKWIEDRSEAFVATTHGRDIVGYVDLAAKRDGTLLGLKLRLIADIGAYNMLFTADIPTLTMMMANATYNIPAIRTTLTEVFTNKTPTDAYRGAGRPEATYFVERAMDMLARELKMDPAELRRKNFIQPDQFPFTTQMGAMYDSGDYENALNVALKAAKWDQLKAERDAARAQGRLVGLGLAMYVEVCGIGPVLVAAHRRVGTLTGDGRARRPHHRHHRRVAARAGQRNDVRTDARRPVRRADSSTSRFFTATRPS